MKLPEPGTYNPFYQFYFNLVPQGDLMEIFMQQMDEFPEFIRSIPVDKLDFAYAPGKWTIREAINHVSDTERVYAYRSLVAARMDSQTNLTSFDENAYALHADVSNRSVDELIADFRAVRQSSVYLFKFLNDTQASFQAKNGNHVFTANGGLCFMIGHVIHHENVIKSRYLNIGD
ncbi:MAG TPA: DinB family protein [Saprospiraceae bacterium]|nr:DinB family protein [Saprospiraceae bacterium]